ncbi:uncharacterized protein EV422DRAFT_513491, partial [Fimicolochytrium jonesii]|uniref:uncharacterized protein n=1 Tax=Fimicolochytrium jonesii TaxID=1396493 RepID=UPI0022FEAD02
MDASITQRRRKPQEKGTDADSQEPTGSSTAVAPRRTLDAVKRGSVSKLVTLGVIASVFALGTYVTLTSPQTPNQVVRKLRAAVYLDDQRPLLAKRATAGYTCDPTICKLPNCFCPTKSPAGGLAVSNTPQFILLTFDDAVQVISHPLAEKAASSKNPNGCRIPATFFVSNTYTNYHMVQMLHGAGHEIALHTMSHIGNPTTPEIDGCRKALNAYAGIPLADMKGFRAPFLEYNMTTYAALRDLGLQWDCSNPVDPPGQMTWPYTLDEGFPVECNTGTCDYTARFPGLWEIPMNTLMDPATGTALSSMDPPGDPAFLQNLFRHNFKLHWENGRLPFGVWLHAAWFLEDPVNDRMAILTEFFDWARSYTNNAVWFVTPTQLLTWLQNPIGLDAMQSSSLFACPWQDARGDANKTEICNGVDDNGSGYTKKDAQKKRPTLSPFLIL